MLTVKTMIVATFYSVFGRRVWIRESIDLSSLLSFWLVDAFKRQWHLVASSWPLLWWAVVASVWRRRDIDPFTGFSLFVHLRYVKSFINGVQNEEWRVYQLSPFVSAFNFQITLWRISEHEICVIYSKCCWGVSIEFAGFARLWQELTQLLKQSKKRVQCSRRKSGEYRPTCGDWGKVYLTGCTFSLVSPVRNLYGRWWTHCRFPVRLVIQESDGVSKVRQAVAVTGRPLTFVFTGLIL